MPLLRSVALLAILALPATAAAGTASALVASGPTEYEVKAAFLYNFAKFVEWPAVAFKDPREPFVIAVVGRDPFGASLDEILAGKTVNGRRVEIWRVADPAKARGAQIVYVPAVDAPGVPVAVQRISGDGVLTVGDADRFAARGGIIGFRIEDRRVRFDINPTRAERAGLRVSSQLLKLARIVEEEE